MNGKQALIGTIGTIIAFFAFKQGPLGNWVNPTTWIYFAVFGGAIILFHSKIAKMLSFFKGAEHVRKGMIMLVGVIVSFFALKQGPLGYIINSKTWLIAAIIGVSLILFQTKLAAFLGGG